MPHYAAPFFTELVMQLYDGPISSPNGKFTSFTDILEITNAKGSFQSAGIQIHHASLGNIDVNYDTGGKYYIVDAGGNPAELDVYFEITIDGAAPLLLTPVASQTPSETRFAQFNTDVCGAFSPGYRRLTNNPCGQDNNLGFVMHVPFSKSLRLRGGYEIRMTPNVTYTAATHGGLDPNAKAAILYSAFGSSVAI
jgi:hypothetical protein